MAKLIFSVEELIKILISNELLPKNIVRLKIKGDNVHFYIKTQSFLLPFIPASLKFLSFENNNATFEFTIVNSQINKAINQLDRLFDFKIPVYMRLEYPKFVIDIDELLREKNIRGIRAKDIYFGDGTFNIVTESI
jgi:hypothetical protein